MDVFNLKNTDFDKQSLSETIEDYEDGMFKYRERRHADWNENYQLYRDIVVTNRFTQRQSVNIPLMKYALASVLKEVDDPPLLYFDNLDNDEQAEIFLNEYWKEVSRLGKMILKDIVDKKQNFIYGRSIKKQNITDGLHTHKNVDCMDFLIDRYVDPTDIDSAHCMMQQGIYVTLSDLIAGVKDGKYDEGSVGEIVDHFENQSAEVEQDQMTEELLDRNERHRLLGIEDTFDPVVGETYIHLSEVYIKLFDKRYEKPIFYIAVRADVPGTEDNPGGKWLLCASPAEEILGQTEDDYWQLHTPFSSWACDLDATDFWSDGIADIIRNPNKVINIWYSQMTENRTLRSFGMTYYDSTGGGDVRGKEAYVPQTYVPVPFGWYPVNGDPNKVTKQVDIPDLSAVINDINFVIGIAEKAVATNATQQGAITETKVTLGEVSLALQNAKERIKGLSVFYNDAWLEFGTKFIKMLEGNSELIDEIKIVRKGRLGKRMWQRMVSPSDWQTVSGFRVDVKMLTDKMAEDTNALQKWQAVRAEMPNNLPLRRIYRNRLLDFANATPDERKEILEFEKQNEQNIQTTLNGMQPMEGASMPAREAIPSIA